MSPLPLVAADGSLPQVAAALDGVAQVVPYTGPEPPRSLLRHCRALVVRSVTRVDARLLARAPRLEAVASATAGTDHVDRAALAARGVSFVHAPGANASAVAEYVATVLCTFLPPRDGAVVGVVGFGQVGRRVCSVLGALGYRVRVSDPPLAWRQLRDRRAPAPAVGPPGTAGPPPFESLAALLPACDAISLHVPLVRSGPHRTVGLLGRFELPQMRPHALVVQTSRGDVLDLSAAARSAQRFVVDVWPDEPFIDPRRALALGDRLLLATPHVAGHTHEAKRRAVAVVCSRLAAVLGRPGGARDPSPPPPRVVDLRGLDLAGALQRCTGLAPVAAALRRELAASGRVRLDLGPLRRGFRRELAGTGLRGGAPEVTTALLRVRDRLSWFDAAL